MNMWGIHADFDTPRSGRGIGKGIVSTICELCPSWLPCPVCSSLAQNREKRMEGAAKIIKSEQYDFIMFQVTLNFFESNNNTDKVSPHFEKVAFLHFKLNFFIINRKFGMMKMKKELGIF